MIGDISLKLAKAILEILGFLVIGLLVGGIFFRQVVFSHFDLLLGDVGDARFNGVILEHWWQVVQGTVPCLSPSFFFPVQGALGYSDAGFLNAIPYIVLRYIGIEAFTAYQIVLFALIAAGWIGMVLFCRHCLKLSFFPTVIGAGLFVFPNSIATSIGHTQLLTVCLIPYLAIASFVFLQDIEKRSLSGVAAGIALAVLVPAIFFTSYYIGWFSLFFVFLFSGICCARGAFPFRSKTAWQRIVPYCLLSGVCFIPFLLTYLPMLKLFGSRSYQEMATMLPTLLDYVNVGPNNWIWGKTLYSIFAGIGSRPMAHELVKGLPPFSLFTFVAFGVYFIYITRRYQLSVGENESKLSQLAAGLCATVFLAWLLLLKIQNVSLWWVVMKLIPGAGGIRAVYRFQHVLAFPISLVVAIGLHQAMNYLKNSSHSCVWKRAGLAAVVGLCFLLAGEQINKGPLATYSKQQQRDMFASIHPPPEQAKVFALLPAEGVKKFSYEAQIDAMILAQKFGLKTINGYSGQFPPGWGRIFDFDRPEYIASLERWIAHYNLQNDQLYFLDIKTGAWLLCLKDKGSPGIRMEVEVQ